MPSPPRAVLARAERSDDRPLGLVLGLGLGEGEGEVRVRTRVRQA